jgi:amino-acid N-acetyltransferase
MSISIRPATTADVEAIHVLLRDYASEGQLLARSTDEICEHLSNFVVAEREGAVRGCGSLEVFTEDRRHGNFAGESVRRMRYLPKI